MAAVVTFVMIRGRFHARPQRLRKRLIAGRESQNPYRRRSISKSFTHGTRASGLLKLKSRGSEQHNQHCSARKVWCCSDARIENR